ncbi:MULTISPECIES: acetolactate decarboxylase [Thiorhodovibrio]|uniref:acetolactate decarboxylase n=1 Tax=Thiorhodovibrio TaxID=61593 RepID=UPI001912B914|nr:MULTISPECIES: acetolactate decarboxylase [Thiorhodovibrio]MBK5968848.1 acetolactate decarboxylase [Thiorhodovibrio winogradskyi]WPL12618.1 Alpha-acetolactate decarboxylase precursor [Thiorhodovibrio litoralis]
MRLFLPTLIALTMQAVTPQVVLAQSDRDTLFQISTIDALLAGVYQPLATLDEVLTHGDFGLGTFAGLDGELILIDGDVYQAASDGQVRTMPGDTATPFISLTWFDADEHLEPPSDQDYAAFKTWLEERLPSRNLTYAVRVEGNFAKVHYRSVPGQKPPYRPLKEVAAEQTYFTRENISGTLIGFWCPSYVKGLNVPGFHLHFLSNDRESGGHLLDFTLSEGKVTLDPTTGWALEMPMDKAFLQADLSADRAQALHSVEQGKSGKD